MIRNLKYYRFQSVVLIFTFTLTFIISSFIPIWIDKQQLSYVESSLENIPIHLSYALKYPLISNDSYEIVERNNEVNRSFVF